MYVCDNCGKEYETKQALGGHKSVAHNKKGCKHCGELFSAHVLKQHENSCVNSRERGECENCGVVHDRRYGSGRFCSETCARSFATKGKRQKINKKVSETLYEGGRSYVELTCEYCGCKFEVVKSKSDQKYCSISCCSKSNWEEEQYRKQQVKRIRERASDLKERKRLRDIGRKGSFGKCGETDFGVKYEFNLEKECFETLHNHNVEFEPHPEIPNTSKISDLYIPKRDCYIEIDGIDREKFKDSKNLDWYDRWVSKLELYEEMELDFKVVKSKEELKKVLNL